MRPLCSRDSARLLSPFLPLLFADTEQSGCSSQGNPNGFTGRNGPGGSEGPARDRPLPAGLSGLFAASRCRDEAPPRGCGGERPAAAAFPCICPRCHDLPRRQLPSHPIALSGPRPGRPRRPLPGGSSDSPAPSAARTHRLQRRLPLPLLRHGRPAAPGGPRAAALQLPAAPPRSRRKRRGGRCRGGTCAVPSAAALSGRSLLPRRPVSGSGALRAGRAPRGAACSPQASGDVPGSPGAGRGPGRAERTGGRWGRARKAAAVREGLGRYRYRCWGWAWGPGSGLRGKGRGCGAVVHPGASCCRCNAG